MQFLREMDSIQERVLHMVKTWKEVVPKIVALAERERDLNLCVKFELSELEGKSDPGEGAFVYYNINI